MRKLRVGAALLCAFLVFGACGTGEQPALEPTDDGGPATAIRATPMGDGKVEVEAYPQNFKVVNKLGQAPVKGEGHIHFYRDVEELPTTPGQPAITKDKSTYHAAATTKYTWEGVEKGKHFFGIQLVNNDHTPLEPAVTNNVEVTVD